MIELMKSIMTTSLATTLVGAREVINLMGDEPANREDERIASNLSSAVRSTMDGCGPAWRDTFRLGDRIQREAFGIAIKYATLDGFESSPLVGRVSNLVRHAATLGTLNILDENTGVIQ